MTITTRSRARREAADDEPRIPPNLNNVPTEIINIIVEHMRAGSEDISRPPVRKIWQCPDMLPTSLSIEPEEPAWKTVDPCLSLSCVSKSLRSVVFNNRINRAISLSYCDAEIQEAQVVSEVIRSNVRDLRISAWDQANSTADATTLPLSDLIKLFPNAQYLSLDWELQLAGTSERLVAPITVNNSPSPTIALFPQLTTLMLDFTGLHDAKGFGAAEMTMLFRHLRLYNLQTLRIKMRPTDTEDLQDGTQWLALQCTLERMQFPQLTTVDIEIAMPVYEVQDFNATRTISRILEAVANTRSVESVRLVLHYELWAVPSVLQLVLRGNELDGNYSVSQQEMMTCLKRVKLANPTIRNVACRILGELEYAGTMCTLMDCQYQSSNPQGPSPTQDDGCTLSDRTAPVAEPSVNGDEVTYHLCSEAVQVSSDALWDYVEDRPDVGARFGEFRAQMHMEWASEPESDG